MKRLLTVLLLLTAAAFAQNGANGVLTVANAGCVSGSCVSVHFDSPSVGGATIQLSGAFTATVQFEASNDGGATFVAINGTPANSTTGASSATTANIWQFNVAGFTDIRARCSAFTSAPSVVIRSTVTSAKASGGGSFSGGTVTSPILLPDGSAPSPAIAFTADPATGLYSRGGASNHQLVFSNNTNPDWAIGSSAQQMLIGSGYSIVWSTTANALAGIATTLRSRSAANFTFGSTDLNGSPVAQTLSFQNAITGSNLTPVTATIAAPLGTGNGAGSAVKIQRAIMQASGTTAHASTDGFVVGESKTLSNTTATTTALANISVPSNSSGGSSGTINVSCNDGTNFDSETVSFVVSYVNKATVLTIGTVQLTTASTANNSGSCTTAVTATAGTNSVNINVTPVITTIVPTSTTGTVLSLSSYATGNVTIN